MPQKRFDERGVYEYTSTINEVLQLRAMSDRQRERFLRFTAAVVNRQAAKVHRLIMDISEMEKDHIPTAEETHEVYDPWHKSMVTLMDEVGIGETKGIVESWSDPGDWWELNGLFSRVIEAETAHAGGSDAPGQTNIPLPEAVDTMDDKEIESLGGSSAANVGAKSTSRSASATATSSGGARRSTGKKRKT